METQDLLQEIEQEIVIEHATVGQRFANYLIDILCVYAIVIVFGIIGSVRSGSNIFQDSTLLVYACLYSTVIIYYTITEGLLKGRTLGKLITRTRVVKEDGSSITFGDALKRSFSRIVPFEVFSAFGGHPWHDRWTQTYVVKK
ncbi:RDD family protein [Pinibacter aurantiacus]|uniref:RDD family protein n=1 Tax=Pinibacter aurantiacus TaxID=2851599 RepID=A0A9E2W631_9BACT|nr:RDD family protein [Pinibacter aurantiacus]MBV4359343.1 RDD family protein [Pinibacter aurantiacus]